MRRLRSPRSPPPGGQGLWALEEAYYTGRYGAVEYKRSDAEECVRVAEEVVRLAGLVRDAVERGEADGGEAEEAG